MTHRTDNDRRGSNLLAPGDVLRRWWAELTRFQKWGVGVVAFGLLALLPLFPPPFLNTPGISLGGTLAQFAMVAIIAIGLNVVVGQAGLLDLGYVGFYAVGAYTVALLTSPDSPLSRLGHGGLFSSQWAWLSCVPIAMCVTALAGLILGIPTLRLRGDYLAIVTLGFGEIIRLLADNLAGVTNGPRGLNQVAYPRVGETAKLPDGVFSSGNSHGHANYGTWWFWLGLILIVALLILVGNLERSRVGRAWVAIREDEDAAEIMGVNTFRFKPCFTSSRTHYICSTWHRRRSTSSTRCCSCPRSCWAGRATNSASSSAPSSSSTCPTAYSVWNSWASTSAT